MLTLNRWLGFEKDVRSRIMLGGERGGYWHISIMPSDDSKDGMWIELEFESLAQLREFVAALNAMASGLDDTKEPK